ncbi:ketopantoate reductase family protein [Thalassotalea atypica]|uniref:ketopantoate reductase family protein n=1 Tax=Thalassotalea atypica TaxID=2054316 RepID=UPI0025736283|nr:2-dehydropantoate 2-reductase [Thalassotalea atypica]
MKIVVAGQGAIGGLWASHLAKNSACEVSIFPTSVTYSALKDQVEFTKPFNDLTIDFTHNRGLSEHIAIPLATRSHLNQASVILVCVKAFNVATTLSNLLPLLNETVVIILCHNGMGTVEEVASLLTPTMSLLAMLTTHGAFRAQKNHVIHTGIGETNIGLVKGSLKREHIHQITSCLHSALREVNWHNNIKEKQWLKLAVNCVINPITSINSIKNGHILDSKFTPLVTKLCEEISLVTQNEGLVISAESLYATVKQVAKSTANNCSSMLCDINSKQRTEIDYITGYLLQKAKRHHLELPENHQLYLAVKALEEGRT